MAGAVVGVAVMVPVGWLALLVLPMTVEITAEKGLGGGHRPLLVAIGSALAGLAMGATIAWLLVVAGPVALALAVIGVWVAAQVALVFRHRRSPRRTRGEGVR